MHTIRFKKFYSWLILKCSEPLLSSLMSNTETYLTASNRHVVDGGRYLTSRLTLMGLQRLWRPLKIGFMAAGITTKSISNSAQYVTLRRFSSHPSLVMYSFATPPIELKLGQQIGGGLLIANHLDQFWWANHKHWAVRSYLIHFFLQVHSAAAPFTSYGNLRN
jgi:hypothetical protein